MYFHVFTDQFSPFLCLDVNECELEPSLCKNGQCENFLGGYRCRCDTGFAASPDETECEGKQIFTSKLYMCVTKFMDFDGL